jgi:hypothetical protein
MFLGAKQCSGGGMLVIDTSGKLGKHIHIYDSKLTTEAQRLSGDVSVLLLLGRWVCQKEIKQTAEWRSETKKEIYM